MGPLGAPGGPKAQGPRYPGDEGAQGPKACRDPRSQGRLAICFRTPLLVFMTFWAFFFERGREGRPSLKANKVCFKSFFINVKLVLVLPGPWAPGSLSSWSHGSGPEVPGLQGPWEALAPPPPR